MKLISNSSKAYEILNLLRNNDEKFGLEMVKASNGKLKTGTIYTTLSRMESKGYISSRYAEPDDQPGLPRRLYKITGAGVRELKLVEYVQNERAGGPDYVPA